MCDLLLGHLHGYKSCVENERKALVELKKYIISITEAEKSGSVLPTWTDDTQSDCCMWEGIVCNQTSRRVSEIAFGTLYLRKNSLLNLSLLHPFEDVRCLNLCSHADMYFGGYISNQFGGFFDDVEGYKSLGKLRNLEILDLSGNKFNSSILPFLSSATSLTELSLGFNKMDGPFPAEALKHLTNLKLLDLSENGFNGSIPVRDLSSLRKMKALDLSDNKFSGSVGLQGICEMKNLQELDLSNNKLEGQFPVCLTGLTELQVLDLSSNQLSGNVPSSLGNLVSLKYLSLIDNNFEGFFSLSSLANLSELRLLKLSSRSNSLQVVSGSSWKPTFQLSVIALPSCNLVKVPYFLLYQKDLSHVDLSENKIAEAFPSWLLENNTKLEVLFLQNNIFTSFQLPKFAHKLLLMDVSANEFNHLLPENIGWIFPHLRSLILAYNGFQGNLPPSLGNIKNIGYLDMSHNSLPRHFVNGCHFISLSHNKLSGEVFPESFNFTGITELFMDNNLFTGNIGRGLRNLESMSLLDISNNRLTGVIPSWIGEIPYLYALLISNNMLEGEIPASLFNTRQVRLMDLSENMLSGDIPVRANSTVPKMLFLQDNHLSGIISDKLQHVELLVLDLRNNRLSGNIPKFIKPRRTQIVLLRGNNFTGSIPWEVCGLRNIQLLDLSDNKLTGSIPPCLSNTSFGLGKELPYYDDFIYGNVSDTFYIFTRFSPQKDFHVSPEQGIYFKARIMLQPFMMLGSLATQVKIEFATKHRYDSYKGENLKLLHGMDLSKNELSGEIPVEIGALMQLESLNLSHNNLSGVMPESFQGLKHMESLDLSSNWLQGRIPPHSSTFDANSYLGNPFLCGKPINTSCEGTSVHPPDNVVKEEEEEGTIDMESFYWSFAGAYVTIFVGLFASLSFDSPWSRFWFYKVEVSIHKVRNWSALNH